MKRASLFYVAAIVALAFFGCEVCPFIHRLGQWTLGVLLAAAFGLAFLGRAPLERWLVLRRSPFDRAKAQFQLDFGLFLAAGTALTVYDLLVYGFPVVSGIRLTIGCATIGFFAGVDAALVRERAVFRELSEGVATAAPPGFSVSFTRKFLVMAIAALAFLAVDLYLLAAQDLAVVGAGKELALETGLALALVFAFTVNAVVGFSQNLKVVLDGQRRTLDEVAQGRLEVRVPVTSQDEFGLIAEHTNRMIAGLRDRARVRDALGKLVSPAVAGRLLDDGGLRLGGERRSLVVLFSDVRGFTARTERVAPEQIVGELNLYFTRMVDVVHAHGGVVDKFIGDGLMAVFGLEAGRHAADDAVRAAAAMQHAVAVLNRQLSEPLAIGTGIHAGEVVAGTIGSPERLEFTFIGDTVNSAARIEGLTKELGTAVLVSGAVYEGLSNGARSWPWLNLGVHSLRGRTEGLALHGLSVAEACRVAGAAPEAR